MDNTFKYMLLCFTIGFFCSCASVKNNHSKTEDISQKSHLPKPPNGKKWVTVNHLSDEFNGTTLDTDKWMPRHPFWSGRNSTFTKSNVSVAGGNLKLKSTLRSKDGKVTAENVTSACVASTEPRSTYGYYEARIKSSNISMTSSFWFQGNYSEIDVIENIGDASDPEKKWMDNSMMTNTHYFKNGWDNDVDTPFNWTMPTSSASEFHTYGVWWKDEKTIWFYHNGTKVHELILENAFKEKQTLYFDTEIFTWRGWPTKESLLDPLKNTMLVDWVRAWELVEE